MDNFSVMDSLSKFPKELEDGVFYSLDDTGLGIRYEWEYVNGKQHGIAKGWSSNGNIKSISNYNHGVLVGDYTEYFYNGMLREKISYNNGDEVGERKQWYMENNNALKWIITYINGEKLGSSILYYMDGTIKMEGWYYRSNPIGAWRYNYTHDYFETTTIYSGKVFDGNMDDGDYLCWNDEEEHWINSKGWNRMERPCSSWIRIKKGKIVKEVKFQDIGFDGKYKN